MTENEKKKEYLKSYIKACKKTESLKEQLENLRETSVASPILSDMPKGSNAVNRADRLVIKILELEEELKLAIEEQYNLRLEIEDRIKDMEDGIESSVLHKKYIQGKQWEEVCVEIGYSWKHTHRIHGKALKNFIINKVDRKETK